MASDTTISAITPEGIEYTLRPAGLISRGAAFAIDEFIQSVLFILPLMISITATGRPLSWFFFLGSFAITWFYYTCFEVFWNGRSPGKRIMGIRVVMANGSPISPSASVLRNILRFADEFLGLTTIGFLSVVFSPGFRRLGDWTASTLVVYERADAALERMVSDPAWLKNRKQVFLHEPLPNPLKQHILSFSSRYAQLGSERADEIAQIIVPSLTDDPQALTYPSDYLLAIAAGLIGTEQSRGDAPV